MGGQQFRQFFTAGARSSLLGPVPMGMAIKSPMMGFPPARPFHPHARYYNNNNTTTTTAASSSSSLSSITNTVSGTPYVIMSLITVQVFSLANTLTQEQRKQTSNH